MRQGTVLEEVCSDEASTFREPGAGGLLHGWTPGVPIALLNGRGGTAWWALLGLALVANWFHCFVLSV